MKEQVQLPPHNVLSKLENEILPTFQEFEHGWKINLTDAVSKTLERFLQNQDPVWKESIPDEYGIKCFFSGGCDGSGSHSVYNSESSLTENVDTSHMLISGFSLTQVQANDEEKTVLFKDSLCSSSSAERPWILIPGKESKENFSKVIQIMDAEINAVQSSQHLISGVKCQIVFDLSQLDGKAIINASGLGGAYCTCCKISESDAKLPERVKQGFSMDRCIDELHELYSTLIEDSDSGEVKIQQGDYKTRTGLTCQPQTTQDVTKNIPITHAYLRSLSYFEVLIYRINANVKVMGKGKRLSVEDREKVKQAKEIFRKEAACGPLHMRLDQPDSSGHGGNSDTGQMSRTFFSSEKRDNVIDLIHGSEEEKQSARQLHKNFSIILRVISSKAKEIDVESFEEFCLTTYLLLIQSFPWASVPQSIHRILAHSAERIRINDNFGLGNLSEESLESVHKLVRRFRSLLARKTSLLDNLRDVFKHLWIRSNPIIRSHERRFHCTYCDADGHTKRSCPRLQKTCFTESSSKIESFFISE